jgi:hypothetical protein
MPKVLDRFSPGLMEYWSVANRDINPIISTFMKRPSLATDGRIPDNSLHFARELTGQSWICADVGGFHLTGSAMAPAIEPTITEMKNFSPQVIVPMHCAGHKALSRFEEELPGAFLLNSVGSILTLSRSSA